MRGLDLVRDALLSGKIKISQYCDTATVQMSRPRHKMLGINVWRDGPFQIQKWVCPPWLIIEEHTHPDVDSYEMWVGGEIAFSKNGKWVGTPRKQGDNVYIGHEDKHGTSFGPTGGVFISIQHWLNGKTPDSIGSDWEDASTGEKILTLKDAASDEDVPPYWYKGDIKDFPTWKG